MYHCLRSWFTRCQLSGQVLLILSAVMALGGASSLWLQRHLSAELTDQALASQVAQVQANIRLFDSTLLEAEHSVQRFAELISDLNPDGSTVPDGSSAFTQLTRRDPDGAWRSRADRFRPGEQAGIWIPPYVNLNPRTRAFFALAQPVTSLFGLGVSSIILENSWVLPLTGGEVIFWPSKPDFIRHAAPDLDYRSTPWVQLTAPAHNPEGQPRWTQPEYDPAARDWLISVVAPFQQQGRWAGSVGHDILLRDLLRWLVPATTMPDGGLNAKPLYVVSSDGRLIVEGVTGRPSRAKLPAVHRSVLAAAPVGRTVYPLVIGADHLVVALLPRIKARAVYQVDSNAIAMIVSRELSGLQLALTLFLAFLLIAGLLVARREILQRQREQLLLQKRNLELEELVCLRTQELADANRELARQASEDALTAIPNRRSFDRCLAAAWGIARRRQEPLALLLIDVDHFKIYNDSLGHPAGDACLRNVAALLQAGLHRPEDQLFRYGGEEFVVLLANTDPVGALHCGEQLRRAVVDQSIPHPQGVVSVSIGIACSVPAAEATDAQASDLVATADAALYAAKQQGRNCVVSGCGPASAPSSSPEP